MLWKYLNIGLKVLLVNFLSSILICIMNLIIWFYVLSGVYLSSSNFIKALFMMFGILLLIIEVFLALLLSGIVAHKMWKWD